MTFRTKLILLYSSLLVTIIVLFGGAIFAVMRFTLISTIDDTLSDTADLVVQNIYDGPALLAEFGGRQTLFVQLPQLDLFRASSVYVQVWGQNRSGDLSLAAASQNLEDFTDPVDRRALGSMEEIYHNVVLHGTEGRVLTRPVIISGQLVGNVQVAASLETVNQATDRFLGILLVSLGIAVLGSVAIGMWLSQRALQPIEDITEAAGRIAVTDDLSTRLTWGGPLDELGRLSSVFNQMMDRLEHLFKVQRQFVADVSHELRTPLTAIRGNVDIIKRYGVDEQSVEAIESETERMSRMVSDLLLLARADYGSLTLELAPIDLDEILTETFREARTLVHDRDLNVRIGKLEPLRINGNADRMKQLLLNLVSNALKFTPDGGTITLNLFRMSGDAVLQVQDTGCGIKPEDLDRIFDRFYQADASRTRSSVREGAGLGLSIARWIAEAHGGTISAASELGKGTTFTIIVPLLGTQPKLKIADLESANGHKNRSGIGISRGNGNSSHPNQR